MIDLGDCLFLCDECPIIEGLDYRLALAEEFGELQLEYCGCDKVDSKFYSGGYCEDAFNKKSMKKRKGQRQTGNAYRRRMKKKKLEREKKLSSYRYNPYIGWPHHKLVNGEWIEDTYMSYPRNSNLPQYFKKYSNRKVRHSNLSGKGNQYRRVFDMWWNLL